MTKAETKISGAVYTPKYIVENILDLSGYYGENILKKNVIDNSCGDGAFLTEIVSRYCRCAMDAGMAKKSIAEDLGQYVHGIEINEEETTKCIRNLNSVISAYGIDGICWDVICADSLSITKYNGRMDYVLGNPPYVRVHNLGENFDRIKRFMYTQEGMTDLYIVFFEIGLRMLNSTGVLGYITPSSYFNSVAGTYMRRDFVYNNLIERIVDLKHYQAFDATTYTAITILKNGKENSNLEYYEYNSIKLAPEFVERLTRDDYYISDKFFFGRKESLKLIKDIFCNRGQSGIEVKNGYATLCDGVFINDFSFSSKYIIPVIKASTGAYKEIFYPYDKNSKIIPISEIEQDEEMYEYLYSNREKLVKRSNEKDSDDFWYLFGRSQGINDTYRDKLAINALLRDVGDWKIIFAPSGTGIYSGLYITSSTIGYPEIANALKNDEFMAYITLLGKYKSGGYYTFSSKDVKAYLDYKFSFDREST